MPVVSNRQPSQTVTQEVARLLRERRIGRGLSMNRVAQLAKLSQQMVSYVERGLRSPTLDTLLRIADALDVDLWKLLKQVSTTRRSARRWPHS